MVYDSLEAVLSFRFYSKFAHDFKPSVSSALLQGSWWQVDLGSDVSLSEVKIYNRILGNGVYRKRLSHTTVSLLNEHNVVLGTYQIGDASNIDVVTINYSDSTTPTLIST